MNQNRLARADAQFQTGSSGVADPAQPGRPSVASELLRGNTDVLDRVHPHLGPGLFVLACLLLVFGLWLKWKGKKRHAAGDGFAGLCR